MKSNLLNIASLCLYFIPLALLTGPFLPDLFVSIIALVFVYSSIVERKWYFYFNRYFFIFLIFVLYLIFASLISDHVFQSLSSSLFYFRFGLFSLGVWYLLESKSNTLNIFSISIFITFVIALLDGYIQFFFGANMFGLKGEGVRLTLLLSDEQILGGYLSRLFPLLIASIIISFSNNKLFLYLGFFLLIFTDILIYISGERTAFGLLFISTLYIIFLISKYKLFRIVTFLISLIIISLITVINPSIKDRNISHTLNQMGISSDTDNMILFSEDHQSYAITSFKIFKENIYFGNGPNTYRISCQDKDYAFNEKSCSTHPHNTYLQLLSEIGLVGTLPILLLFFIVIITTINHLYYKIFRNRLLLSDYQICLFSCFLLTLWPLLPTQNFFNNWINVIYFLPVGFYLHSFNNNREI